MYEEIVKIFIWSSEVHCTAVVKVVQTFVAFSEKLNFIYLYIFKFPNLKLKAKLLSQQLALGIS